ncbi:MAG: tetratricopeptide repeat protein [Myxococcota bacterium]
MTPSNRNWPWMMTILGLGLLIWLPAITPTLIWDDTFLLSPTQLERFWQQPLAPYLDTEQVFASPYFRPLAQLSFALFFGVDAEWQPALQHALNVALHLLNTAMLMGLVQRVLRDQPLPTREVAGLVGILFMLSPLQVEAVTWISGRPDLLAASLCLGALHALLGGRVLSAAGLWGLALLAKESAVPFGLLGSWYSLRKFPSQKWQSLSFLAVGLGYTLLRQQALLAHAQRLRIAEPLEVLQHALLVLQVPGAYLLRGWRAASPCMGWELSVPFQMGPESMASLLLTLLLLGGVILAGRLQRARLQFSSRIPTTLEMQAHAPSQADAEAPALAHRRASFPSYFYFGALGASWLLLFLLPVSQVYRLEETVAERYFYLPSMGWALLTVCMAGGLLSWLLARFPLSGAETSAGPHARTLRLLALVLLGGLVLAQATQLQRSLQPWASSPTFYAHQAMCAPTDARAQLKYGEALFQQQQWKGAERELLRAHQLAPGEVQTLNLLAALTLQQKKLEEAEGWLELSFSLQPDWNPTRRLKVSLREAQGRFREASTLLQELLQESGGESAGTMTQRHRMARAQDWDWLGELHLRAGQPLEALQAFEQAERLDPAPQDRANFQGIASMQAGQETQGMAYFRKVLEQTPNHRGAACNLMRALEQRGQVDPELPRLKRVCEGG